MPHSLQIQFFEVLKAFIPANLSVAEAVASSLSMSTDAVYRRMRGESALSLDEALILCKTYRMPLSAVQAAGDPNLIQFMANILTNEQKSFEDYLRKMGDDVEMVAASNPKSIIYAAEDIPVFYHFSSKGLASFKMFYWMKAIQNVENMENTRYDPDMFGEIFDVLAKRIIHHYANVPTTEIWTSETVESTLSQLRFFWDAGFIQKREHGLLICQELEELIQHIKKQVELGEKIRPDGSLTGQKFDFYKSDLMIGTNCVQVKAGVHQLVYISYNTFNSMKTSNPFFVEQSNGWLSNITAKSELISGVAEKQRNQFFKSIFRKIEDLKEHISNN
jgi:hypothetical protein